MWRKLIPGNDAHAAARTVRSRYPPATASESNEVYTDTSTSHGLTSEPINALHPLSVTNGVTTVTLSFAEPTKSRNSSSQGDLTSSKDTSTSYEDHHSSAIRQVTASRLQAPSENRWLIDDVVAEMIGEELADAQMHEMLAYY